MSSQLHFRRTLRATARLQSSRHIQLSPRILQWLAGRDSKSGERRKHDVTLGGTQVSCVFPCIVDGCTILRLSCDARFLQPEWCGRRRVERTRFSGAKGRSDQLRKSSSRHSLSL